MPKPKPPKPTHYKVIAVSMYTTDLERLDAKVREFKARGWTKANKSAVLRIALANLDVSKVPMIARADEIREIIARGAATDAEEG